MATAARAMTPEVMVAVVGCRLLDRRGEKVGSESVAGHGLQHPWSSEGAADGG